jgi:hypothetical protein
LFGDVTHLVADGYPVGAVEGKEDLILCEQRLEKPEGLFDRYDNRKQFALTRRWCGIALTIAVLLL